jgi:acid ceramidase
MLQQLTVDLRRAPTDRWHLTPPQCQQARELLALYKADLGLGPDAGDFLISTAKELVRVEYWAEMESLSRQLGLPVRDVALHNFYYDCLKVVLGGFLGCTAFALDTPEGVLHARNLDWWTENAVLARYTSVTHFMGGPAGKFTTIGWPGFIGAFSGIASGRFAVTLNAVLSLEPAQIASPVVLLLRTVLEQAVSFEEALVLLSETPLPCDCLLLLTGTRAGELVVIERTPSHHTIRRAQDGYVCVTNSYHQLESGVGGQSELLATSCRRFERVQALIKDQRPRNSRDCFRYLSDPEVRMHMTVQQMVFRPATGEHWIRLPRPTDPM